MSKQHPILIASDHAGYELKQEILSYLAEQSLEVIDLELILLNQLIIQTMHTAFAKK